MHVFSLKPTTEEPRSEAMAAARPPPSNGSMASTFGGSSSYLLGASSSLLSFASTNAGSSLALIKGKPSASCVYPQTSLCQARCPYCWFLGINWICPQ